MGFAIGISGLRFHWAWHGVVMGLAVGSIFSYFLYMHGMKMAPYTMIGNAIFGLMIEFFTTVVFKAPAKTRQRGASGRGVALADSFGLGLPLRLTLRRLSP